MRSIAVLFVALLLPGCATAPRANTPSGNAEITVTNVKPDCIRAAFMNLFVDKGYAIRTTTDTQIVAGKVTDNVAASVFFGTRFGGAPEERVTVLFVPQMTGDALRVVVSSAYVSNQGSAFEKTQPIGVSQKDQDQFIAIKSQIEDRCRK